MNQFVDKYHFAPPSHAFSQKFLFPSVSGSCQCYLDTHIGVILSSLGLNMLLRPWDGPNLCDGICTAIHGSQTCSHMYPIIFSVIKMIIFYIYL